LSKQPEPKKPLTEVEALSRISKILNQLDENAKRKVLAFLAG
jgi:hypothetical protein